MQKNTQENSSLKEEFFNKKKLFIAGALGLLVVAGIVTSRLCCTDKNDAAPFVPTVQRTEAKPAVVVALIGNEKVTIEELEKMKNAIPQIREMRMDAMLYNKLLDAYVNNRVMLNAAKSAQLNKDPLVKQELENAQNQILLQAYLNKRLKEKATNEALLAVYNKMMEAYVPEEEIHARHILVDTEKEAKDLIVKLKAGAKFEELADKHTKDNSPHGSNGGDLGYFKKRMMIPEFANAAFAIKTGKFSEKPVKTPFGWHVIKVEDRRQSPKPAMNEIMEEVQARFTEEMVPVIIEEETQKAKVMKLDPLGFNAQAAAAQAAQQQTAQQAGGAQPVAK